MEQIVSRTESDQPGSHVSRSLGHILGGIVLMVLGAAVVLAGYVLYLGNKGGAFPTFPYAGGITISLGVILVAAGTIVAGKRAATGLGSMVILAGIALYVWGLTSHGPLSPLLPFAGVVVAAIGASIIAIAVGDRWSKRRSP